MLNTETETGKCGRPRKSVSRVCVLWSSHGNRFHGNSTLFQKKSDSQMKRVKAVDAQTFTSVRRRRFPSGQVSSQVGKSDFYFLVSSTEFSSLPTQQGGSGGNSLCNRSQHFYCLCQYLQINMCNSVLFLNVQSFFQAGSVIKPSSSLCDREMENVCFQKLSVFSTHMERIQQQQQSFRSLPP